MLIHVSRSSENKKWYLFEGIENYTNLCKFEIDLSYLPLSPRSKSSGKGTYYHLDCDIILLFGLTELEAMVAWKEEVGPLLVLFHICLFTKCCQGVERGSAARIIYDPDPGDDHIKKASRSFLSIFGVFAKT